MGVVAAHLQVPLEQAASSSAVPRGWLRRQGGHGHGDHGLPPRAQVREEPVKWRWTREEEFLCSSTRTWHMEIADAVTKDGWILGRKMLTLHDSGAYARFSRTA